MSDESLPFAAYPGGGRELLGTMSGESARRHYGQRLQQLTGQTCCVYCGIDLVADYHRWLLLSVDHVVPVQQAGRLGIPREYTQDYSNLVVACAGCNGLDNQFIVEAEPQLTWTEAEFFDLRDRVFIARCAKIALRRDIEVAHFNKKSWLIHQDGALTSVTPHDSPLMP